MQECGVREVKQNLGQGERLTHIMVADTVAQMRCCVLFAVLVVGCNAQLQSHTPQKLIIDTDIGGGGCNDVDDVVAVAVGHALADNGEAELLAVVLNTAPPKARPSQCSSLPASGHPVRSLSVAPNLTQS